MEPFFNGDPELNAGTLSRQIEEEMVMWNVDVERGALFAGVNTRTRWVEIIKANGVPRTLYATDPISVFTPIQSKT